MNSTSPGTLRCVTSRACGAHLVRAVGLYDYYPIKYTVQWLQWQLWGNDPTGYHATNIALHALSAFLFWRVLDRLGARHGWLGAVVLVVHPLAVESVAWITELKNTLSLPFLLAAFLRYLDFDTTRRPRDLVAACCSFSPGRSARPPW